MTEGSQFGEQGVPSSCLFGQPQASQSHEKNHLLRSAGSLSEKGRVTLWNLPREAVGGGGRQSASANHLFLFVFRAIS